MKSKSILNLFTALLFNVFIGSLFSMAIGAPLLYCIAGVNAAAVVLGGVHHYAGNNSGLLFDGLLKEIWISKLMEKFYPEGSFMTRCVDMSEYVTNNTINLADAGIDPDVLVNNTDYPIEVVERTDNPLDLPLDYYDTVNTVVRNAEAVQLAYNKMESVVRGHRNALLSKFIGKSIYNWSPSADATYTPVISTTGAARVDGSAFKQITLADIMQLQLKFDMLKVPVAGRVLVLHPKHRAEICAADISLFKAFANLKTGEVLPLYGFDVYVTTETPMFNYSTGAKVAYGAASAGTDGESSIAYHESEVMKAMGGSDMFTRLADPYERGDIIGFQQRFVALSIRGKYKGAIRSYHA